MLFAVVSHPELLKQLPEGIDGIELRLDLFPQLPSKDELSRWIQTCPFATLLVLRKASHGGGFRGSEAEREALIEQYLALSPSLFDLEWDMRSEFVEKMIQSHPKIHFIISYHNFDETPPLHQIYQNMQRYPAYLYKISAMARSTNDALRMLLLAKEGNGQINAIPMGDCGSFARILGPVVGNRIDYAKSQQNTQTAPGQILIEDLYQVYHYRHLNPKTALFGLIGDPVSQSLGHIYHNKVYEERALNAVYVKMDVKEEELKAFFPMIRELGFRALSVTSPLKEKVLPFLDQIDEEARKIGAVNTIVIANGKMIGSNCDGIAALDAIEKRSLVLDKTVVILGAGGAARAIAHEAKKRGARVFLLNRTLEKAREIAESLGCQSGHLYDFPPHYDILINCAKDALVDLKNLRANAIVMDATYVPKQTQFLLQAQEKGCDVIYGEEMFFNQAAAQANLWLGGKDRG